MGADGDLPAQPTRAGRRARSTYALTTWVFLRLLGVVYLIAFWSLATQARGLVGAQGILPAAELMASARQWAEVQGLGVGRFLAVPTLCWLGTSDAVLVGQCVAGAVLALLLTLGLAGALVLPLLWMLYLSMSVAGGEFLAFQWDTLLVETGLLAMLLAPWRLVHLPRGYEPNPLARWLVWWLLFRLMFQAGVVKLASGDPLWRNLTALTVHYETQPLPTPLGWYAHHLPMAFQEFSTAVVLAIELLVPWFILVGRRPRLAACAVLVGLQFLIASTGNFAFFNLLTIALTLTLLDDQSWAWLARPLRASRGPLDPTSKAHMARWACSVVVACLTVPVTIGVPLLRAGVRFPGDTALGAWALRIRPLRSVNVYGLFAVMTPTRPEIIIEGSRDGVSWLPYELPYKPGDVRRAPPWVAPHQPRLDWQLWFAALDEYQASPWVERLLRRLLEGEPAVEALFAVNPFADAPPRFVRARRAEYHMASLAELASDGIWWVRETPRAYSPIVSQK